MQDAFADVGIDLPDPVVLPSSLTHQMRQLGIPQVPEPQNAALICGALGSPYADSVAGNGLVVALEQFRSVSDDLKTGLGVVIAVVFTSCGEWIPYVESALDGLF
jgi:hypothetical protein